MSERIMQISTFDIDEGKLEPFKQSIAKAVAFAEAHGPQLLVEVYIDEGAMRAHSYQIMTNSEAILAQWKLSDPYIRGVMDNCRMRRLDIYGQPSLEVLQGLSPLKDEGVDVTITPSFAGYTHFQASMR